MEVQEILEALTEHKNGEPFPCAAMEAAIEKQAEITPYLIENVKWVTVNMQEVLDNSDYFLHLVSLYLLGQFKENLAYQPIADFFSVPGEISLDITGDLVTEDLYRILVLVSNGDVSLIKALIENSEANEYVRCAGMRALTVLYAQGILERGEIISYFNSLFDKFRHEPFSFIHNKIIICSYEIYPEELLEQINSFFEEDLVERFFVSLKEKDSYLEKGKEECIADILKHFSEIDVLEEMPRWLGFKTKEQREKEEQESMAKLEALLKEQTKNGAYSSTSAKKVNPVKFVDMSKPKIGRNEPCPCGSGKKYKKCCLNK